MVEGYRNAVGARASVELMAQESGLSIFRAELPRGDSGVKHILDIMASEQSPGRYEVEVQTRRMSLGGIRLRGDDESGALKSTLSGVKPDDLQARIEQLIDDHYLGPAGPEL